MPFCSKCGSETSSGAKFCANCGAATASEGPPSPTISVEPKAPSTPSYTAQPQPVMTPSSGIHGLILPAMVVIAALIIGYLLLEPRLGNRTDGQAQTATAAAGEADATGKPAPNDASTPPAGTSSNSVDAAAEAADIAAIRARESTRYIAASTIDFAFHSDPIGAGLRYAGPLRVTGIVATTVQPGPTPSISLEGRTKFNYMIANFPDGYTPRLIPLMRGETVSLRCEEVRGLGGTTILSGCLLS